MDNHIKGLELHPLDTKGMENSGNDLLTRTFPNRKKTRWFTKLNKGSTTMGHMDITMDGTNVTKLARVM